MTKKSILIAGALALVLNACSGADHEDDSDILDAEISQTATPAEGAASDHANTNANPSGNGSTAQQVVIAADAVAVGNVVGDNGAVAAGKTAYATTDTVYASVPVGGYPSNSEVAIFWFAENGSSIKDERRPIAVDAKFMNFSLSAADGMAPGRYTAQIDIGETPVGMADFVVK